MRTATVKRFGLLELIVLIAILMVLIGMLIPCCRSLRENAQEYDSSAKVLKDTIIKGERGVYRYTKFNIEGHDYFLIGGTGAYRKGDPVSTDPIKRNEESSSK